MRTLVATAVRDRPLLVDEMLRSVRETLPAEWRLEAWLDPLDLETGVDWLLARGVRMVHTMSLDPAQKARPRVALMRFDAVLEARRAGFDRVLFLDSDVLLGAAFVAEFERLWPLLEPNQCGALSLGNYKGYGQRPYLVQVLRDHRASIRTRGLGACLAFPVTEALARAAGQNVGIDSWDTFLCRGPGKDRVLTSDTSYVIHQGRYSGMCMRLHMGLDFCNAAPDLLPRLRPAERILP